MTNGDIIALVAVLVGLLIQWLGIERRMTRIETKLDIMARFMPCMQIHGKTPETSGSCNPS